MKPLFDENEIRKSIAVLKPNGTLFEIRVVYEDKRNFSGYFRDAETLIRQLKTLPDGNHNVYMTLNNIKDACYSRVQRDCFVKNAPTTSDIDIESYAWMLIDLDPSRPKGTSANDVELDASRQIANKVYSYMKSVGFASPIVANSGNGVHLLYGISMDNCRENAELIKKCLKSLDMLFSNDIVKIDQVNFNPSRICKLYGTLAMKGRDTDARPHRMSNIVRANNVQCTEWTYLEKLTQILPEEPEKKQYNNYNPGDFDLDAWMTKYGMHFRKESMSGGTKYILDRCPFDEGHTGKDACVFKMDSGAIGFKCLHNSCADKKWSDLRKMFEPDAYEQRQKEQYQKMYYSFNRDKPKHKDVESIVEEPKKPLFYTAEAVLNIPQQSPEFIKTGIVEIDQKMRGLEKGYLSLWSGLRGSAKSTVLSEIVLNAVEIGNNVGVYSGELTPVAFMRWMFLQAAGKTNVQPTDTPGFFTVSQNTKRKIANWLGKHLWLYNNEYGHDYVAIREQFEKAIDEKKLDLLILDNLMSLDTSSLNYDKWQAQTNFVQDLSSLAKRKNVHIAFVAHPRKSMGFLRLEDISGTADLANTVEDAFIIHRCGNDFRVRSTDVAKGGCLKMDDRIFTEGATNCIEICKDREFGNQDVFIPLWYEAESKRLKNDRSENIIYGWDDDVQTREAINEGFIITGESFDAEDD